MPENRLLTAPLAEAAERDKTRETAAPQREEAAVSPMLLDQRQLEHAEARMRQALGMEGRQASGAALGPRRPTAPAAATRRHRFVQDGEVPVTVVPARDEHRLGEALQLAADRAARIKELEAALAMERAARERAHREAQTVIRDLQTKLVHVELARDEAIAAARAPAMPVRTELPPAVAAPEPPLRRKVGRPRKHPIAVEPGAVSAGLAPNPASPAVETSARSGPAASVGAGRKQAASARESRPAREPKPVRWWIKPKARKPRAPKA